MSIYVKDTARGVRISPSFKFLGPFCDGWLDCMSKYHEGVPYEDDWPFWYGERPLVGFLTSAVWQSGSICIEEYQTDKKGDAPEVEGDTYLGRGDLYFCRGKRQGNIEFKMHDVGISRTHHFRRFLKTKWDQSKHDALKCKLRIPKYGGMFLRPYIGKDRETERYETNLRDFLEAAWNRLKPDALAWWCPAGRVIELDAGSTENLIVGVVLVIKRVN